MEVNRTHETRKEVLWNAAKAYGLLGIGYLGVQVGLSYFGHSADIVEGFIGLKEAMTRGVPFIAGFGLGLAQNTLLIKSTLNKLNGRTERGNHNKTRELSDGTVVFQLSCVDGRRKDKTGLAVAGSFALMGAEVNGLLLSMATQGIADNTPVGDFASGYFLGSNVLSFGYSHLYTLGEIMSIAKDERYKKKRIKIEMMDHFDGCGAEGFTSIAQYFTKFKTRNLSVTDLLSIPNEVAGYLYVNGILGPTVGLLTGGRVSLSAITKHSEMIKSF